MIDTVYISDFMLPTSGGVGFTVGAGEGGGLASFAVAGPPWRVGGNYIYTGSRTETARLVRTLGLRDKSRLEAAGRVKYQAHIARWNISK